MPFDFFLISFAAFGFKASLKLYPKIIQFFFEGFPYLQIILKKKNQSYYNAE